MPRRRIAIALTIVLLFLLFWLALRLGRQRLHPRPSPMTAPPTSAPMTVPVTSPPKSVRPGERLIPASTAPPFVAPATVPSTVAPTTAPPSTVPPPTTIPPGQEGMATWLIPKNITIVRCYYDQELVAPGTTFGFDINGSGFTENFSQRLSVDPDALDIEAKDLRLVTANQIHGLMVVGPEATTQYIHPKIQIRHTSVFRAPEPFGVVRPGEVLDILLTGIDENGQTGHFQVLTNLDPGQLKRFRLAPTTPRLEITGTTPRLPFYIDGDLAIGEGVHSGQYGLVASLGPHEIFKKDPLVDVVKPNVGRTGSVEDVKAVDVAHRPGDTLDLLIRGSGFTARDTALMQVRVKGLEVAGSTVTYLSAGRLQASVGLPANAPEGLYGATLLHGSRTVFDKKTVFAVVPPNWLGAAKLTRPLEPGSVGTVQITGRDLSPAFVQSLRIDVDEPGLQLSPPRYQDGSTIIADIQVSSSVAPGDYWLHLSSQGKPLKLPGGSLIKIGSQ